MKKTLCIIIALLLFIPVIAHTDNDNSKFYVATNGNDDNPGSKDAPVTWCSYHAVRDGLPVGKHYGRFAYDGNRPKRWPDISDIRMHGYWTWDWADAYMDIEKIDTIKHEVYQELPKNNMICRNISLMGVLARGY